MHGGAIRCKSRYACHEMIVECSHCGAPLDVRDGQRYTRCRYCNKTSQSRELRTIEQQTPPGWRPPPVWRPPTHVPANSDVQLAYRQASAAGGIVVLVSVLMVVGVVVAAGIAASARKKAPGTAAWPGGPKRLDPSALSKVTLKESPEQLAEITGVTMDAQHSMRVPLAHEQWEAVTFRWDPEHLDHVKDLYFNGKSGSKGDASARKAVRAVVGRRLEKDSFQWEGAGIYISNTNDHIGVNITITQPGSSGTENPFWHQQSEALWKLVRSAALGVGTPPKPADMRDYLGGGYPVGDLAKLDLVADIDASDAAVHKVFPGAVKKLIIDLEYKVAIDHPWYGDAEISWKNKKGARLAEVSLRPPPGASFKFADQKAVDACVEATFGKPQKSYEGAHLGGSRDTTWRPAGGGEVRVYEHMLVITLRDSPFSSPMPDATWKKAIDALDRCGRKAD